VIALRGGLGAGKTTLAKGIGLGLGVGEEVTSPTYTIVSEYEGRLRFHHMDAYRLSGEADFEEIGGPELLADRDALSLVEWSERVAGALPPAAALLELEILPGGGRLARLSAPGLEELLP
jgi:tRNA threonylcarbamoyladenosine biosynthesis protein TsaE